MSEENVRFDMPNFLKPYAKGCSNKCKDCKYLVVTKTNSGNKRGRGECYHSSTSTSRVYCNNPKVRYFSDQACRNFEKRSTSLNLFDGGIENDSKISKLYEKYKKEYCRDCKCRLYYHDDISIFCKCKKLRHTIEEV